MIDRLVGTDKDQGRRLRELNKEVSRVFAMQVKFPGGITEVSVVGDLEDGDKARLFFVNGGYIVTKGRPGDDDTKQE